jgi:DnaJ-class molecular chaperone
MEKSITLQEALCGFKFHVKHMDGSDHIIESQEGEIVAPGALRVVSGLGMPFRKDPFSKGRLIIRFVVAVFAFWNFLRLLTHSTVSRLIFLLLTSCPMLLASSC